VGLYVVLPSAAQADLDRLRGETSHCEALFAYSTDQKNISSVFTRGHHLSNMFRAPQLYYLLRQAVYRMHAMIDVYIRLWHTRNTTEGRIYTPVAVDVLTRAYTLPVINQSVRLTRCSCHKTMTHVLPRSTGRANGADYAIMTCDRYSAPPHGRLLVCR